MSLNTQTLSTTKWKENEGKGSFGQRIFSLVKIVICMCGFHCFLISVVFFARYGDCYVWNKVTTCIHNILSGRRWIEHYGEVTIRNTKSSVCICKLTFVKVNNDFKEKTTWYSSSKEEVSQLPSTASSMSCIIDTGEHFRRESRTKTNWWHASRHADFCVCGGQKRHHLKTEKKKILKEFLS